MLGQSLHCSFCGKPEAEVAKLVAGAEAMICDTCTQRVTDLMRPDDPPPTPLEVPWWRRVAAAFRRQSSTTRCAIEGVAT